MSLKDFNENNFHPQAALVYKWIKSRFKQLDSAPTNKKHGWPRATLKPGIGKSANVHRVEGKGPETMSKLSAKSNSSGGVETKNSFFNLETHKISFLVPEMRFYKSSGEKDVPFYFPVAAELHSQSHSFGAAAIKSLNVNFIGNNPFEASKYLEADMELHVDNISLLFMDPPPGYARLADLFTISIAGGKSVKIPGLPTVGIGDFSRPIEVTATLGYTFSDRSVFTEQERREILESNIVLRMNVKHHNIQVNEDGSASISINYMARINQKLSDRIFSITDDPSDVLSRVNILQLFHEGIHDADSLRPKRIPPKPSFKNKDKKTVELRKILEKLDQKGLIYRIDFNEDAIKEYRTYGKPLATSLAPAPTPAPATPVIDTAASGSTVPSAGRPSAPAPAEDNSPGKKEPVKKLLKKMSTPSVYFVTFGDLIQAFFEKTVDGFNEALKRLESPGNDEDLMNKTRPEIDKMKKMIQESKTDIFKFRILLTEITFRVKPQETSKTTKVDLQKINLADIPISLPILSEFLEKEVNENFAKSYTLNNFLDDCVKADGLIDKAIGIPFSETNTAPHFLEKPSEIKSSTHTAGALPKSKRSKFTLDANEIPGYNGLRKSSFSSSEEYFIIYEKQEQQTVTQSGNGNKVSDSKKGVYHFELGKNRGLIKGINFSRYDAPFQQEQLMTNQVGFYDELKLPYKASVEMVGNNLFIPGSQIYINPSNIGFGLPTDKNSPAHRLGIGGYYTVLTVSTSVSNGTMSTTLDCSFGHHADATASTTGGISRPKQANVITAGQVLQEAGWWESPDGFTNKEATDIGEKPPPLSSILQKRLQASGLQFNLCKAISKHFTQEEGGDYIYSSGIDRVVPDTAGRFVIYIPRREFSGNITEIVIYFNEDQPGGQVKIKRS